MKKSLLFLILTSYAYSAQNLPIKNHIPLTADEQQNKVQMLRFIDSTYHQIQAVLKTTILQKQEDLVPATIFNKHLKQKIAILKKYHTTFTALKSHITLNKLSLKNRQK